MKKQVSLKFKSKIQKKWLRREKYLYLHYP